MRDLIYRHTAIDALGERPMVWMDSDYEIAQRNQYDMDKLAIETVPSAQLEPCEDAQHILDYLDNVLHPLVSPEHWNVYSELHDMIAALPSAQPEQRWIPCSERFPEEDDYKSCIECLDGAVWYFTENGTMGLGYYYKSTKEWSTTGDLKTDGKVIAWKPLPEPYERRQE